MDAFDTTDGRIKGVMFFHDDNSGDQYTIDYGANDRHAHWAMGNRAQDSECPVNQYTKESGRAGTTK